MINSKPDCTARCGPAFFHDVPPDWNRVGRCTEKVRPCPFFPPGRIFSEPPHTPKLPDRHNHFPPGANRSPPRLRPLAAHFFQSKTTV